MTTIEKVLEFAVNIGQLIEQRDAARAEVARLRAIEKAARAAVDAAGTHDWPVNCDALRAALEAAS